MFMNFGSQQRGRVTGQTVNSEVDRRLHTITLPTCEGRREDALTIRLADSHGQRSRANMLLKRMYSWRGYGTGQQIITSPNSVTFTASSEDVVIGTLTLTVDSAAGLASDKTFGDEMERFRSGGRTKVCELTKFAFDTSLPARPRLASLFHIIFIYGSLHFDCTDLFIEVNPRHRRFYEVMLGFTAVGEPRLNTCVNAPAQLMWLNVADIRRQIDKYAGDERYAGRTLYSHFFSLKEEEGIYGRLVAARNSKSRSDRPFGNLLPKRKESRSSPVLTNGHNLAAA